MLSATYVLRGCGSTVWILHPFLITKKLETSYHNMIVYMFFFFSVLNTSFLFSGRQVFYFQVDELWLISQPGSLRVLWTRSLWIANHFVIRRNPLSNWTLKFRFWTLLTFELLNHPLHLTSFFGRIRLVGNMETQPTKGSNRTLDCSSHMFKFISYIQAPPNLYT